MWRRRTLCSYALSLSLPAYPVLFHCLLSQRPYKFPSHRPTYGLLFRSGPSHLRLARTPQHIHTLLNRLLHNPRPHLHRLTDAEPALPLHLRVALIQHAVDVHLCDPALYALRVEVLVEAIGAVQHEADVLADGFVDGVEALEFEVDAPGAVGAVDVAKRRGEPVDARVDKVARFGGGGHDGFEVGGVGNAVLAALDAARFGFADDAPVVAVRDELFGPGEVVRFFVVAHVDHDGVVETRVRGGVDGGGGLGVVEVEGYGDGGGAGGGGGGLGEEGGGVGLGPGEEEDHGGGGLGGRGADGGEDAFKVVLGGVSWGVDIGGS